tara:strand:+ start:258 stop:905 length:648 start_codon:yes stop_codon:yes gene_type:complete
VKNKALIVEDHPVFRDAIKGILSELDIFDEILGVASLAATQDILQLDTNFKLIILDLNLDDTSGPEGIVFLRDRYPEIPVVIFSGESSTDIIIQAYEYGIRGFIRKSSPLALVCDSIKQVVGGGFYFPEDVIDTIAGKLKNDKKADAESVKTIDFPPRQHAVFMMMLEGHSNRLIAERLHMAEGTVKAHLSLVYQALNVKCRAQAILKAVDLQII